MIELFSWTGKQTYRKMESKFAEVKLPSRITVKSSNSKFLKKHMENGEIDLLKVLGIKNRVGLNYNTEIWNRSIWERCKKLKKLKSELLKYKSCLNQMG